MMITLLQSCFIVIIVFKGRWGQREPGTPHLEEWVMAVHGYCYAGCVIRSLAVHTQV